MTCVAGAAVDTLSRRRHPGLLFHRETDINWSINYRLGSDDKMSKLIQNPHFLTASNAFGKQLVQSFNIVHSGI